MKFPFQRKITDAAVGKFADMAEQKVEEVLKPYVEADLDGDGKKDLEEIKGAVGHLITLIEPAMNVAKIPVLVEGFGLIVKGFDLIKSAVNVAKAIELINDGFESITEIAKLGGMLWQKFAPKKLAAAEANDEVQNA